MSDQSIATIARSLAAALLPTWERRNAEMAEKKKIEALQAELCAEYHAETIEALKVIA
ncbi:hypothetical protein ABID65_007712 [Bradyrhizobium sp. S3.9.2]